MTVPKRNDTIKLNLSLVHPQAEALSAALVTEAEHLSKVGLVTVSLESSDFNDLRARWNTVMRALIASDQSLIVTTRG